MSLAKYLFIVAAEDDPGLDVHDIAAFFRHVLGRVDWSNDLHFQTRTTIDTLDYSGHGFNAGSKVVVAAAGPVRRALPTELPAPVRLPDGFRAPRVAMPGVLAVEGPAYRIGDGSVRRFCETAADEDSIRAFPLVVVVDDSEFVARTLRNSLWVTFTRSNPAADIDGVGAFTEAKHWGCAGPLVIDARVKPHHAPPLVDDPDVERRVDALGAPGGPLHGII
jgi:4-hydroxy-3-polyprenylbenzoate decarboxylase